MSNQKTVGVIFSGCGVYDGSEIHEAVATMAALEKQKIKTVYFAPDKQQMHVINHITGEVIKGENRSVLVESARITRGNIKPLNTEEMNELDGIIFIGGFGAAKNLCDYAVAGTNMKVDPLVEECVKLIHQAGKPIAALCISPVILAKMFGSQNPLLTLGEDGADAQNIKKLGSQHQVTTHEEVVVDENLKLITGPCYMLDANIANIFRGAEEVVIKLSQYL